MKGRSSDNSYILVAIELDLVQCLVKYKHVMAESLSFQAMLLHQQREERRKARLVQVRKQERAFAQRVRDEVKIKREEEKKLLEEHLQVIWQP